MSFLNKLIIPSHDLEEREETALSGWMIFFTLLLLMFVILGVYEAIYRPFVPTWVKLVELSLYLLPVYSCLSISLRFRDAIFCTVTSLILFGAIFTTSILRLIILKAPFSVFTLPLVTFGLDIISLAYFLFSKKVKLRFPVQERRAFWFDIIPMVVSALVAAGIMVNSFGYMAKTRNWTYTQLQEFDEPLSKGIKMGDYDDSFILSSVEPFDDKFIFYFLINPAGIYPYSPGVIFEDVDHDYYTRSELKKIFIESNPHIVKTLIKSGVNLELIFFLSNSSDRASIFISNDEISNVSKSIKIEGKLEQDRMQYISNFADSLTLLCPMPVGHGLTLNKVTSNEVKLNYQFSFNDRKTTFIEIEPVFEDYVRSLFPSDDKYEASAAPSFTPSQKILELLKSLEMDLVYTLTAENSNFSKDFTEWRLYGLKSGEENISTDPLKDIESQTKENIPKPKHNSKPKS